MDRYNNEKGQAAAKDLVLPNKWNLNNLEKSALDELRSHELKVVKPGLKIPEVSR